MRRLRNRGPGIRRGVSARRWAAAAAGLAVATVPVLPATAAATPAPSSDRPEIIGADAPTAIDGEYVVVLQDARTTGTDGVTGAVHDLAREYGADVLGSFSTVLDGFSASMSPAAALELSADPAVAYVEQNQRVSIAETQSPTPSWGLDRLDQRDLPLDDSYTYASTGAGVTAYVVDTGIRTTHDDFDGRAVHGIDTVDGDGDATDCNGHGTHVAGTVGGTAHGVAKEATLVGVRVLDCAGSGTFAGVIDGIDFVVSDHEAGAPAVANLSLGGAYSQSINDAVAAAVADGVTFAVAAGNESQDACNTSPASEPTAITVGATEDSDARSYFSNHGTCLDIFAPGSDITSAWHSSDSATNTISGTSMASPHVAGAAALIAGANPGFSPEQVRDAMVDNATTGAVGNPGSGSPNTLLYTGDQAPTPPDPDPEPEPGCSGEAGDDVEIPDLSTVTSEITISGCADPAGPATIGVDIVHSYSGDLVVTLVAPDGSEYTLRDGVGGSADDIHETYTADVSGDPNGTWTLRVSDTAWFDTGHIDAWTLAL